MRLGNSTDLDELDVKILGQLQDDCRLSLARIGEVVGLSAPSVLERIKKLEAAEVISGYRAILEGRRIGLDVTAFIGVVAGSSQAIEHIEQRLGALPDVLECHHVTGGYTLIVKVKTNNTSTLEELIRKIRDLDGVASTETNVVLSTHTERTKVALPTVSASANGRRSRRGAERNGQQRRT